MILTESGCEKVVAEVMGSSFSIGYTLGQPCCARVPEAPSRTLQAGVLA